MGFSSHEYCSGLPLPSPGGLPDTGIEPRSTMFQAGALPSEPPGLSGEGLNKFPQLIDGERKKKN